MRAPVLRPPRSVLDPVFRSRLRAVLHRVLQPVLVGALLLGGLFPGGHAAAAVPFDRCFRLSAQLHDVDPELLVAVARTESALDPDARSPADAHGLMQIRWPVTARHLGVRRIAELYDPCLNIDLGARYLAELLDRFDHDVERALAAYNYGPTRIARSARLPAGARAYAARVLGRMRAPAGPVIRTADAGASAPAPSAGPEPGLDVPLAWFRSGMRAERAAAFLARQPGLSGTVSVTAAAGGHRLVVSVPANGLPGAAVTSLDRLGFPGFDAASG